MKQTNYRERYSDGKLKKVLNECDNSIELYATYMDWKEVAHIESRELRLINADVVISDLNQFIKRYKLLIKKTDDLMEMSALMIGLSEIEKYKQKKVNKKRGGHSAKETKDRKLKEMLEGGTDFFELPISGFSVNYMYDYFNGKKVRSNAYRQWLNNFPAHLIPTYYDLLFQYNVDLDKPVGIEMAFVCLPAFDCDNFSKSLIDAMYSQVFCRDDNMVHETVCRKFAEVSSYDQCKIYVRFYNI